MTVCTSCGTAVKPGAQFCAQCGAPVVPNAQAPSISDATATRPPLADTIVVPRPTPPLAPAPPVPGPAPVGYTAPGYGGGPDGGNSCDGGCHRARCRERHRHLGHSQLWIAPLEQPRIRDDGTGLFGIRQQRAAGPDLLGRCRRRRQRRIVDLDGQRAAPRCLPLADAKRHPEHVVRMARRRR